MAFWNVCVSFTLAAAVLPARAVMKEGSVKARANDLNALALPSRTHSDADDLSVFVAVSTRRASENQRSILRPMWQHNVQMAGATDAGQRMVYRFMLCNGTDGLDDVIRQEYDRHEDLMLLDCEEGWSQGRLTRKTLHMMMAFWKFASGFGMFMKVEDNTFVNWPRLEAVINQASASPKSTYAGMPFLDMAPCREYEFGSYEPFFAYSKNTYPQGMAGGPGYLLGQQLVQDILSSGLGIDWLLWNEDKAVAVWVDELRKQSKLDIPFVEVPGVSKRSSNCDFQNDVHLTNLRWADYTPVLHYGITMDAIQCLTEAFVADDPDRDVSRCFDGEMPSMVPVCANSSMRVEVEGGVMEVV